MKSPHIVLNSSSTSTVTMRLADGFVSRHHPDAILEFKGKDKDPELYEGLPESALKFLGRPMSDTTLADLAKQDMLEPIYVDRVLPEPEVAFTRSKARLAKEKERAYALMEALAEYNMEEEEESLTEDKNSETEMRLPKTVRFKKPKLI